MIIENEINLIETPFHYVNDVYFDKGIEFNWCQRSQDIKPFKVLENYDIVFLDISLAKTSILDGFGILKKIKKEEVDVNKLVILTGNHQIKEKLIEHNIFENYDIITKPIDYLDLLEVIK